MSTAFDACYVCYNADPAAILQHNAVWPYNVSHYIDVPAPEPSQPVNPCPVHPRALMGVRIHAVKV